MERLVLPEAKLDSAAAANADVADCGLSAVQPSPSATDTLLPLAYRSAFDQSCDGMVLVAADCRVWDINPVLASLVGRLRDDLIGLRLQDLFVSGYKPGNVSQTTSARRDLETMVADAQPVEDWRVELLDKEGATREASMSYSPLTPSTPDSPCGLLVARLLCSPRPSGQMPASFVAAASHDLRTPLTSVKGCASTLLYHRDALGEDQVQDFLRIIDEQSDRLRELIDNLSDISKIESGTLIVRRRPVLLSAILDSVLQESGRRGQRAIVAPLPPDLPPVDVDARRVEQALIGLVLSLGAGLRPGEVVSVDAELRGGEVLVTFAGRGDVVLEAGGDEGTVGGRARPNIQISFCRGILAAHGSRVWGERGPDCAVTVHLTLPIALQRLVSATPADTAAAPDVQRGTLRQPRTSAGKPSILVVDDDPRILRLVRASLEHEGYEVQVARDGQAALDSLRGAQFDVVILDLILQAVDGFEVCRRVREFSTVPIIVLTGKGGGADKIRALDIGADDYLTKPFETAELLARVRAVLRRASFTAESETRPIFVCDQVQVDFSRRRVVVRGKEINLTPTEYKILYQLVTNAGHVLLHEELLSKVWGPEYRDEVEYIRSYIRHLRKKIEDDSADPRYVLTQPGVGYYFRGS